MVLLKLLRIYNPCKRPSKGAQIRPTSGAARPSVEKDMQRRNESVNLLLPLSRQRRGGDHTGHVVRPRNATKWDGTYRVDGI